MIQSYLQKKRKFANTGIGHRLCPSSQRLPREARIKNVYRWIIGGYILRGFRQGRKEFCRIDFYSN